jgi:hypothetical protein
VGGVVVAAQANPDLSSTIVRVMRVVVDVVTSFVEIFERLTEMISQLEVLVLLISLKRLPRGSSDQLKFSVIIKETTATSAFDCRI